MTARIKDGTVEQGCRYHVLRRWQRRGHEVLHVRLENLETKFSDFFLLCDCDFETVLSADGRRPAPRRQKQTGEDCRAKESVRAGVFWELRKAHGREWRRMGSEVAILDLCRRFRDGEFLGQRVASFLYVAFLIELLEIPVSEAWAVCRQLAKQKKIRLVGGNLELRAK